ncbi:MAG: RNA-binding domain-containing protein [Candidatus Micrarchaeota archaeon]
MENEKVEYKKSLATIDEILQSVTAFANTFGGEVYVGINDDGSTAGVSIGKNTIENLTKDISRDIDPKINISIKLLEKEDKKIILISVPSSSMKPHFFRGVAYQRLGKSNVKLSSRQLEDMIIKRALSLHDVDSLNLNIKMSDLRDDLVKEYVKEIGKKYQNLANTIRTLGLGEEEQILPSAVLFFGQNPKMFFPLYGVKCAIFKENDMLAIRDFSDPIYSMLNQVILFIKQSIPSSIKFEGIKRVDESAIPDVVIREALINALINADYTLDATIYIKITQDVIEIKNAGVLPSPLTLDELEKPHISKPRNRRIAGLCHEIKWIEHWGEGTLKIFKEMRRRGLGVEFSEFNGYFSVTLHTKELPLTDRQNILFKFVQDKKRATVKELSSLGIPARTIRLELASLSKRGLIKKSGKGKLTYYQTE